MRRVLSPLIVATLLLIPAWAHAQFKQGDFALTLSADGAAQKDFDTFNLSLVTSPDYWITDQINIGLTNRLNISDGGSLRDGSIAVNADWNFDLDRWVPYVGANIGYQYGDITNDSWIAGPEAGVRYFVNSTTFIQVGLAYEFNLNEGISEGAFFYGAGIGFKF